jgi:hypothetical protein
MRGIYFRTLFFALMNFVLTGCQENQAILAIQSNFILTFASAWVIFISIILLIRNTAKRTT